MIVLVACCLVLLWFGRDEIGVFWSMSIAVSVPIGGLIVLFFGLSPLILVLGLVAIDICLLLRIIGSDIDIR